MEASQFVPFKFLLKADGPKVVADLFVACYAQRFAKPYPAQLLEAASTALKISQTEADQLLEAIRALTKHAIYDATSKETVLEIFPDGFHEKLRDLIAQIISHYLPTWRKDGISKQVSLPRLLDIDWRVDVKSASDRGRMNVPTVLMQLQVEAPHIKEGEKKEPENVTFELDRATIETMLEGMSRIREQLDKIAQ